MKTAQDLLQERKTRISKAVALERNDRPPVVLQMDAFCARHMKVKLSDFCSSLPRSSEVILASMKDLCDADATEKAHGLPHAFTTAFMSRLKLPGDGLGDDEMWQIDEKEVMTIADYDAILDMGWPAFVEDYVRNRLKVDLDALRAELAKSPSRMVSFEEAGYAVYCPISFTLVNECLSGGRSMGKFMRDLYKIPDKVEAVLDVILEDQLTKVRAAIRATGSKIVFVSPARGASSFFAPRLWERFVWKYLKAIGDVIAGEGAAMNVHADGNWERDLDFFKSFPKGACIFESDHGTDIYKIKAHLGSQCCIKGDVPAALLSSGTPDEVYKYSEALIKDMGDGFILSSGCSVPENAKVENVRAMIAAATGN